MAEDKALGQNGLLYFWQSIKTKFARTDDIPTKISQLTNDSGYITGADVPEGAAASTTIPKMNGTAAAGTETAFARGDHVHPTDTSRLSTSGDGSNVTASFTAAEAREAIASGEKLSAIFGKIAKWLGDLGGLAWKDEVAKADLDSGVQASLTRADSALQSYTETDPTVPAWAKAATKPTYTAAEVGAIPSSQADSFALKSDLTSVYKYKGSVTAYGDLPTAGLTVGDVYDVSETGMNYGWTGEAWDPLGQIFSVEFLTNAEIDAILAT